MVRKARYFGDRSTSLDILRTHESLMETDEWDDFLPDASFADGDSRSRKNTEARDGTKERGPRHLADADWLDDKDAHDNCGDDTTQHNSGGET